MDNKAKYLKAFNALKKKFKLKDFVILFYNGKYAIRIRPCLIAIDQNGNRQNMWIDDKIYNVDFAYVDEFHGRYGKVQPWMVAKAMFDLAKQSSIYMISDKSMEDIDCNRHKKEDFTILRKGSQVDCFLVEADFTS